MKPTEKFHSRSILQILPIVFGVLVFVPIARATPYASGVSNTAGTISFILNESADSVRVLLDSGTITNDSIPATKGVQSFSLGSATNYQIVVTKKSLNGFTAGPGAGGAATARQISTDTTSLLNFYYPRGVAVNRNPKSPYFGRIYAANDWAGTTSTFVSRATTQGIYMLNADQTDAVGQGNTARTGSLSFATTTEPNVSPYRIHVGEDDNLYICDWSDSKGNLYRTDPNVSTGSGIFALKALTGTAAVPVGAANNHGSVAACYVTGSTNDGTLRIYAIDEDLQANKTTSTLSQMNSLWRYDVTNNPVPFTSDPTRVWTASPAGGTGDGYALASQVMDLDRAPDGKFFITCNRANGGESGLIVRSSTGGTTLFGSKGTSVAMGNATDYMNYSGAVAVSREGKWVAVARGNPSTASDNKIFILPLTNGVPDLSKRNLLTSGAYTANRAIAVDAAGNLYVVNNAMEAMRIFSPGGTSIATTGNDDTGTNGTFSIVRIDPDVFTQPQNLAKNAGETATFTVTATGSGTLSYQWSRSGTNIAGATKSSLALANVQQADALTDYTVVVTNSNGSVTSVLASLTVTDTMPIITTQPTNRTVNAGTSPVFVVATTGTDPRAYQWRFNDVDILGANASSYTRPNVLNADQGDYTVVITNSIATYSVTSAVATLTVIDPAINTQPKSQTNGAGADVTFSVVAAGTGTLYYQWQTNSVDITGATASSYTAVNVQVEDTGTSFTVVVTNSLNSVASTPAAILTVTNRPPVIITQPANQIVNPSDPAGFTVVAQGENPLGYQWRKNGADIIGANAATLPLSNVQVADAGFYSVVVTNSGGSTTSASAQLVISMASTPGTGTGLNADYWNLSRTNAFTNAPVLVRLDTNVDFAFGTGSPDPLVPTNLFVARWAGQVQPLYSQTYTFYTFTDDGARLWVDGNLLVDKWVNQAPTEWSGTVTLNANQKYDLVMEYYENTSGAEAHLRWSSASQVKQAIPTSQLYPATSPVTPKLNARIIDPNLVLNWMGTYTLQNAPVVEGPYTDLTTDATIGPYTNGPLSEPEQFLRLRTLYP